MDDNGNIPGEQVHHRSNGEKKHVFACLDAFLDLESSLEDCYDSNGSPVEAEANDTGHEVDATSSDGCSEYDADEGCATQFQQEREAMQMNLVGIHLDPATAGDADGEQVSFLPAKQWLDQERSAAALEPVYAGHEQGPNLPESCFAMNPVSADPGFSAAWFGEWPQSDWAPQWQSEVQQHEVWSPWHFQHYNSWQHGSSNFPSVRQGTKSLHRRPWRQHYAAWKPWKQRPQLEFRGITSSRRDFRNIHQRSMHHYSQQLLAHEELQQDEARCMDYVMANAEDRDARSGMPGEITTWMLSGIPSRITPDALEATVCMLGFAEAYDFIYMPVFSSSNKGYAFINFLDAHIAVAFAQVFTNYVFAGTESSKICSVRPARLQGKRANLELLKSFNDPKIGLPRARPHCAWVQAASLLRGGWQVRAL